MKIRFCDQCQKEIRSGQDYYKVCIQKHEGKRQILTHAGDLCLSCWNKNTSIGGKK